jgi:hypothetical protein
MSFRDSAQIEKFKAKRQKKSYDQWFTFLLSTYLGGFLDKKSQYLAEGN